MTTTLLAVDDSKTMRKVLEITFAGEDFRTVLCDSADEALSKLGENPQIALVDAGLDNAAGYELCQKIKAASPNIAVVMLSSKQQPYDRAKGSAVGADDFVDKPFDTQQLIEKVTTIARRAASAPVMSAMPAPVVMPSATAARPFELGGGRPRVQTLAYGPGSGALAPAPVSPLQVTPARPAISSAPPAELGTAPPPAAAAEAAPYAAPAYTAPAYTAPAYTAPAYTAPAAVAAPPAPPSAAPASTTLPSEFADKLSGLGLSNAQVEAVLSLSREVVEQVVWEVVPTLAETIIREELKRLLQA